MTDKEVIKKFNSIRIYRTGNEVYFHTKDIAWALKLPKRQFNIIKRKLLFLDTAAKYYFTWIDKH